MIYHDDQYLHLLKDILTNGQERSDRTGVGTIGVFDQKMSFDLTRGFPLLTTKKLHWPSIVWELLWMIEGQTNVKWLQERGVTIWDEWGRENGDLGPVYGAQWRNWDGIDQLQCVIDTLRTNPWDRRMIVSAWNVSRIKEMALPPCHLLFQFYVRKSQDGLNLLDCKMYQRSVDTFLGCPYNVASYSLLTHIVAHLAGLQPGKFIWDGGDVHIYRNHIEQVETQLKREPRFSPNLRIRDDAPTTLSGWHLDHFVLENYQPHPAIKAPVAV